MRTYEESLKIYRDNKNTMDYAIETAKNDTTIEIAKAMKEEGMPIEKIIRITGLSKEEVEKL